MLDAIQVRLKVKQLAEGVESPLKECFLMYTQDSHWMDVSAFEAWANQSGYPTAVTTWLSKQMSKIAAEVSCMPQAPTGICYSIQLP